ncbi:hypothetical protein BDR04DRAFT_1119799 [Suillus decipiens]|nr:hypothetical protein BDR04DRAFT_1119799 [Suillus decipiens]
MFWTTPINFKGFAMVSRRLSRRFGRDKNQPYASAPVLVIKRIPGMKAISMASFEGNLTITVPSPWSVVQLIVWSIVNRSCHAILNDVCDFDMSWRPHYTRPWFYTRNEGLTDTLSYAGYMQLGDEEYIRMPPYVDHLKEGQAALMAGNPPV